MITAEQDRSLQDLVSCIAARAALLDYSGCITELKLKVDRLHREMRAHATMEQPPEQPTEEKPQELISEKETIEEPANPTADSQTTVEQDTPTE